MSAKAVEKRMLSTQELVAYVGLSRNQAVAFSKRVGACRAISTRKNLHDKRILDEALDAHATMLVPQGKTAKK